MGLPREVPTEKPSVAEFTAKDGTMNDICQAGVRRKHVESAYKQSKLRGTRSSSRSTFSRSKTARERTKFFRITN